MSMGGVLVVMLVALMVIKPKDLPIIIEKTKSLWLFFKKLKKEIFSYLANELALPSKPFQNEFDNIEKINFYLQKIISIEGEYTGNYDLKSVRDKYLAINSRLLPDKTND